MKNLLNLSTGELRLLSCIVKAEGIPGFEEFSMTRDTVPGNEEVESLKNKHILINGENGKLTVDKPTGYIFAKLKECDSFIRVQVLYSNGCAQRMNLYFVDDAFEIIMHGNRDEFIFCWLPTFDLAIGSILNLVSHSAEYERKTSVKPSEFDRDTMDYVNLLDSMAHEVGIDIQCALSIDAPCRNKSLREVKSAFLVNSAGNPMVLTGEGKFIESKISDILAPVSSILFDEHSRRVREVIDNE